MQFVLRNKIIWVLLFLMLAGTASAQRNYRYWDGKKVNFGFLVGLNSASFYGVESLQYNRNDSLFLIEPVSVPGIQFGFVLPNVRLSEHVSFRFTPGMLFAARHLEYTFNDPKLNRLKRTNSVYLDMPVSMKFRTDLIDNSYRVFFTTGAKYSLDFASKATVIEDFQQVKILRPDFTFDLAVGFEMYFPFFKLSPELKLSTGLSDILLNETHQFSQSFDQLRSRTWMVSFYFE